VNRKTLGASHLFVLQGSLRFTWGNVNEFCKIVRGSHKVPFQPLRSKALACVLSHLAEVRELKYDQTAIHLFCLRQSHLAEVRELKFAML
jgi:hypothetical protein